MTVEEQATTCGVRWLDGFVSEETCASVLSELRFSFWTPSTVVNRVQGRLVTSASDMRTSRTTTQWWFTDQLRAILATLEQRLLGEFGVDPERLEEWQATSYQLGERFEPHYDAGLWEARPGGERARTVLIYLDQPKSGGGTAFPCLDLCVEPRPGRLLVWDNLLPDGRVDRLMRHGSLPVGQGRKPSWSPGNARRISGPTREVLSMSDERIIELIIRRYGETINVRENPHIVLDIIRRFSSAIDDGGAPPGGAPPAPPPQPAVLAEQIEIVELGVEGEPGGAVTGSVRLRNRPDPG